MHSTRTKQKGLLYVRRVIQDRNPSSCLFHDLRFRVTSVHTSSSPSPHPDLHHNHPLDPCPEPPIYERGLYVCQAAITKGRLNPVTMKPQYRRPKKRVLVLNGRLFNGPSG